VIVGTGIDLCEVDRVRKSIERNGERFLKRVYTDVEIAFAESAPATRFERYAARFAAKEAGMKAVGTGWQDGVSWHDFEVVNEPSGRPVLVLRGEAARIAQSLRVARVHMSLTHTGSNAMAMVVLESD
jgi:holo-[acyl-carrier protein] synthase